MKEIPKAYVRANQLALVSLTGGAILMQSFLLLFIAFLFVITPLLAGPKANLAFVIAKQVIKRDLSNEETEAAELQRFNQLIAAALLTAATIILLLTEHWIAWVFTGMVTTAASIALMGYCIGCTLYYQLKKISYILKK